MSILDHMNPVRDVIVESGKALDNLFTSDKERMAGRAQLQRIQLAYESERTRRHEADMKSDSRFAKLVRPVTLVCLLLAVVGLAVTDGNIGEFVIKEKWIDLLETLASAAFVFYFGGRSLEKAFKK
jgi:hypothetical protein